MNQEGLGRVRPGGLQLPVCVTDRQLLTPGYSRCDWMFAFVLKHVFCART